MLPDHQMHTILCVNLQEIRYIVLNIVPEVLNIVLFTSNIVPFYSIFSYTKNPLTSHNRLHYKYQMEKEEKFIPFPPLAFNIRDLWEKRLAPSVQEQLNNLNDSKDKRDGIKGPSGREKREETQKENAGKSNVLHAGKRAERNNGGEDS